MKIAVVGATSNLGRQMLAMLADRYFSACSVDALTLKEDINREISFGEEEIVKTQSLENYDFSNCQIAMFAMDYGRSKQYIEKAIDNDCIVIDNSYYFNNDEEIPLIIPQINPQDLIKAKEKRIIANPTDTVIQMLLALYPLHKLSEIKRIVISTYQSVSGLGKDAMDELFNHTKKIYENEFLPPVHFSKQMPFNVIPQVGYPGKNGYYTGEESIINETHRLLGKNIGITATCVRVPVFTCNSESINVEFNNHICEHEIEEIYEDSDTVMMLDRYEENVFATPLESALEKVVFVSRIRKDDSVKNGINMWTVTDNMILGSALNAVGIVELLLKDKEIYFDNL